MVEARESHVGWGRREVPCAKVFRQHVIGAVSRQTGAKATAVRMGTSDPEIPPVILVLLRAYYGG